MYPGIVATADSGCQDTNNLRRRQQLETMARRLEEALRSGTDGFVGKSVTIWVSDYLAERSARNVLYNSNIPQALSRMALSPYFITLKFSSSFASSVGGYLSPV